MKIHAPTAGLTDAHVCREPDIIIRLSSMRQETRTQSYIFLAIDCNLKRWEGSLAG